MLYNLHLLTDEELEHLFIRESTRFLDGVQRQVAHNELNTLHHDLLAINSEMEKRKLREQRLMDKDIRENSSNQ